MKPPKLSRGKKGLSVKPKRPFNVHAAFGTGPKQAFNDQKSMVAPDQAFSAAMAQPQGAGAGAPAAPMAPPVLPGGQ
jgi:hypothetical protein